MKDFKYSESVEDCALKHAPGLGGMPPVPPRWAAAGFAILAPPVNVPLVKLQRYSCHLPVSLKGQFGQLLEDRTSRIWNAKTVGELFTILSYFWDYLHPDLLHYLVKRFGIEQTIDLMSGYVDELSKFRLLKTAYYHRYFPLVKSALLS